MPDKPTTKKALLDLSRPVDKSLKAYKKWINGIYDRIMPGPPDDLTEEEWIASHKKFWGDEADAEDETED